MTEILIVAYVAVCIAWARYLTRDLEPLRNWQGLLSWTVFLPLVLVGLAFAALGRLKDWLRREV